MTTQTILIDTYDYGASLTSATLRVASTDALVATADTTNEVTADSGLYAIVFGESSVIPAGTYRLRAFIDTQPITRYVTLGGVDGETVISRSEMASVLETSSVTSVQYGLALESTSQSIKSKTDNLPSFASNTVGGLPVLDANSNIPSNVRRWRGNEPGNIDSNGFVPSNLAAINGNTTRAATFAGWTDYNEVPADTDISGLVTVTNAIKAKTDNLPSDPADQSAVESAIQSLLTTVMTESYNSDGSAPTLSQAIFLIMQRLTEFAISGNQIIIKKLDGSSTAATITMDSASSPTSSTRSG